MQDIFRTLTHRLSHDLVWSSRALLFLAVVVLPLTFLSPLWRMEFYAQQYPEGLTLYIYSHALVGGDEGNDLTEINVLNHYIGMKELAPEDFTELKWIPLIVGGIIVLTLRAAVIGTLGSALDLLVISVYFGLFSLWSFWYKLSLYGHELDPRAAVKVDPFTPPVFGHKMVGQFEVWSYPSLGTALMALFGILLLAAIVVSWRRAPWREAN
jgi:hypothetical protein